MTIESSHATSTARTSAADPKHAKGKSTGVGSQGGAPGGDFMAILAAMDPQLAPGVSTELADSMLGAGDAEAALKGLQQGAGDEADAKFGLDSFANLVNAFNPQDLVNLKQDAEAAVRDARKRFDSLEALAAGNPMGVLMPNAATDGSATLVPISPSELFASLTSSGLTGPADQLAISADQLTRSAADLWAALTSKGQVNGAEASDLLSKAQLAFGNGPTSNESQLAGVDQEAIVNPAALSGLKDAPPTPKLDAMTAALASLSETGSEAAGKTSKLQRETASRQALVSSSVPIQSTTSGQFEALREAVAARLIDQPANAGSQSAAVNFALPTRREDPTRERSVFRQNVSDVAGVGQGFFSAGPTTSVQSTPAMAVGTEQNIAEKVAYWISNDVQSAELTLDGMGVEPVEVTIRMHGNEAFVAFRTDELQARAALENASVHLKELLQREGLVLSGVSVGTAGADDSAGQGRQPRQGMRQAVVTATPLASAGNGAVSGRGTGNALDLFV